MNLMHRIVQGETRIAVGFHEGAVPSSLLELTEEELRIVDGLSPRKKTEWLASRKLLFELSGQAQRMACTYDAFGKPILLNSPLHISVSHSEHWCSAMISPVSCGVDIQVYTDTVSRIASRFITASEYARYVGHSQDLHMLHALWGAKECIYKAYGKRKLGFRENIFITDLDPSAGTGFGEIRYEGLHLQYELYFRWLPEVAWVYCLEHRPV